MQAWQQEMRTLKIQYFKSISKEFYRLNGGEDMVVRPYSEATGAGFIKCIVDYLGYHGHCTTAGSTISGYASIRTKIKDKPVLISIRVNMIRNSKGEPVVTPHKPRRNEVHFVASDMQSFIQWYKTNFLTELKINH